MVDNIQVLVVADNLLARAGLAALLDTQAACFVVGQATSSTMMDVIDVTEPDVILYDMGWRVADVRDSLSALAKQEIPVLALIADESDSQTALAALTAFAVYGLLLNESNPELLQIALQTTVAGLIVIDPAFADMIVSNNNTPQNPLPEPLTPRENDVLQLLAQGMTNKAIAHQCRITDHTVKFHVSMPS
ncbi:MAG: response regulator transcription factor [Anaerolineae bacterium]|nr:response regulator transcription factor [Anaerolineae bacterium]